ncbi:FeoB-associated Cys-rich membrane protein [Geovibrio thiophilus]|uniref:FeoB-associated Cys-rich membrane protein n=1 Tax=Geovibrio thiophilus TaxID=139438 RepID=A0A3R6AXR6_9BACT|nr:FeoB-associated Cys-rich membrane protein [Geovibrio thiophilus]QAR32941.1 FeoB-associated Cys-rich membrane protein [Geovibrio thiophilus]
MTEKLILLAILAGAVYVLYYKFFKSKGCGCGDGKSCCGGSKHEQ